MAPLIEDRQKTFAITSADLGTIKRLIEYLDKVGIYRDSAGNHPHLIPPLHQAISFGALSLSYPTKQSIVKYRRITYPSDRKNLPSSLSFLTGFSYF
jgi:hypothetical protein